MTAHVATFLPDGTSAELRAALARLARTEDVVHVAVMPDAHVAEEVCVGTVTATTRRILPAAVGGDIGCGMVAVRLQAGADLLADREQAARLLAGFYQHIPHVLHSAAAAPELPDELREAPIGDGAFEAMKRREGRMEFGTLGRGNHFLEVQRDDEESLWLLVHSGSRAMGPAIRHHFEGRAERDPSGLAFLEADSEAGRAYLDAAGWAARYAQASRARMLDAAIELFGELFGAVADSSSRLEIDHNHVRRESHGGRELWVHRKGAMGLPAGEPGVVPGSMGSESFHVEGRGHPEALDSSAHGAGRAYSRAEARKRIGQRQLLREAEGVWFDHRIADRLREEAPSAYKDIGAVMRAQRELVRIVRRLRPVLVYKAA
ncbi:RtcB family protein [Polyangium jinanense]|uniref:3'-phosphate/5'-hydroxy nucleic acid ligase n=1 Tax=Polyangium jinanense TaxID=2829994 RepID=A0A9X3XC66_9BACT|nr:RtcB family protein [Polyangium jinanense]MDC3959857.1 RtcB family protein [Polyangium jinanense]MDC3986308.1 RtcB family protein [Polyangium jinanense]